MPGLSQVSEPYLYRQKFNGVSLKGITIEGKEFDECAFRNCSFQETTFSECVFRDSSFFDCDLSMAEVPRSSFIKVGFNKCRLTGINWAKARWPSVPLHAQITFQECMLSYCLFLGVALKKAAILDSIAHETDFSGADLTDSDFTGTELAGAIFNQTNLSGSHLERAHKYSIDLRSNKLAGAHFSLPEAVSLLSDSGVIIVD